MKRLLIALLLTALAQAGLAEGKTEERAKMKDGSTLQAVNVSGSITVSGWRKNEIEVIADLGKEAERLIFERTDDGFLVEVEQKPREDRKSEDRKSYGSNGSRLEIRVPHATYLKIRGVSADVVVSDIRGNQRIRTVSGDIKAEVDGEEAELRSVSGDIRATATARGRDFTLYSVSGDVTARSLGGEIRAEAVSGDLDIGGVDITEIYLKTVSGEIEARLGLEKNARVHLETVSGDVEAQLPGNFAAEYELTSHSGDISDLFGNQAKRRSKYSPGSELIFTHDKGKARVRANTLSGDIELTTEM